ncbi:hypothetical protein PLESTM_001861300 [Pleodorina starrii]|nr:hypothetical protein PLESTM_001861300 [Pleodorina starrii]
MALYNWSSPAAVVAAKLEEKDLELQRLRTQLVEVISALATEKREKESLASANIALEARVRALGAELSLSRGQLDQQTALVAACTQQCEEARKQTVLLEPLQRQVEDLSRTVGEMAALRDKAEAEAEVLRRQAEAVGPLRRQLEEEAASHSQAVVALGKLVSEANSRRRTAEFDLVIEQTKYASLMLQKLDMEEGLRATRQRYDRVSKDCDGAMRILNKMCDPNIDFAQLRPWVPSGDKALLAAEAKLKQLETRVGELEVKMETEGKEVAPVHEADES